MSSNHDKYLKWTKFLNSDTFMCAPVDGVARGFSRLLIVLKEILLFFVNLTTFCLSVT